MERKHPECLCEDCPLSPQPYVPWYTPPVQQLPILFVGQAPGEDEVLLKRPFIGAAGKMHWSICKSAGINRDLNYHTNAVACFPPGDRKPDSLELRCCFPRLKAEILSVKPKLIIALGDSAMEILVGKKGIMKERGRYLQLRDEFEYPCKVLCTIHPSFVRRQRQWIAPATETLASIHAYLEGKMQDFLHPEFTLDPDEFTLREYMKNHDGMLDFDTETTGLNTLEDEIIGHSVSSKDMTAMSWMYQSPKEYDPRWQVVKEILESKEPKTWQNGSFDTEIVRTHQVQDDGFAFDTRLAQQLLNSDLPSDLDFLRSQYTKIPPYKPPKSEMKHMIKWGREKLLEYAAWDAYTTREVRKKQQKLLSDKEVKLMQTLLIPLVRAIGRIERRGFRVNVESMAKLMAHFNPKVQEIEARFWSKGINPRSPKQLKDYFGLKTTKEEELENQIKRGHSQTAELKDLLDFRSYDVMLSKYIIGIYRRLRDGRIHTHLKIEGTGTGRLSSENPNLQNVPEVMRVIYEADPGYILLSGDYSQIELWVGAILAGGGQMLKDLQDGIDVHYVSCQLCFPNVPLLHGTRKKDFTHMQGLAAKTVTFGTFYGRSAGSIAREFGVTTAEAERWQLRLLNKYPELATYRERVEKDFKTKGYLETPFGRRRYVQSITQGYNFPVQSSASDVTLTSIVLGDQAGLQLLISVHDSIVFQVPKDRWLEDTVRMRDIMERPVKELMGINFKVTYDKGENWYELEDVTDAIKQYGRSTGNPA